MLVVFCDTVYSEFEIKKRWISVGLDVAKQSKIASVYFAATAAVRVVQIMSSDHTLDITTLPRKIRK